MICIDFVAGSHGHFLEYCCNKHIANIVVDFSPFTDLGSSHRTTQQYDENKFFHAYHWSLIAKQEITPEVVQISFEHNDLLALSSVCFLRAGDLNININALHIDTFNKLNNSSYRFVISQLNSSYPFLNLSANNPHCPRFVLREFFKFGFRDPQTHGLMIEQYKMHENLQDKNVFDFQFRNFYDRSRFMHSLHQLANWCGHHLVGIKELESLHDEFLSRQVYRNHKDQCDQIIQWVIRKESHAVPALTLMQESYINGVIESLYQKEMPFEQHQYFVSTGEIVHHLETTNVKIV